MISIFQLMRFIWRADLHKFQYQHFAGTTDLHIMIVKHQDLRWEGDWAIHRAFCLQKGQEGFL